MNKEIEPIPFGKGATPDQKDQTELVELRSASAALAELATGLPEVTDENVHEANMLRLRVTATLDRIDAICRKRIDQSEALHKGLIADWKTLWRIVPLRALEAVDAKLGPYLREKRRLKQEAEERMRQAKVDAENKRRADEQRLLDEAKALEDAGKPAEAEKKLVVGMAEIKRERPPVLEKPSEMPNTPGTTLRTLKKWRVSDFAALPAIYKKLVSDNEKIDSAVRAVEGDPGIPGVEVFWEDKPVKARF